MLREPYRFVRRAFEIWVDHGLAFVFKFAARKIGAALRGRPLTVEDHTWTPTPGDYETWIARTTPAPRHMPRCARAAEPRGRTARQRADHARRARRRSRAAARSKACARRSTTTGKCDALETPAAAWWPSSMQATNWPPRRFAVVKRLNADPPADIVYSDQDVTDDGGQRASRSSNRRDPELLLATNYLGPFTVMRRAVVDDRGGMRREFGDGQVYDLMLRASERTTRIAHVPNVLCHPRPRAMTRDGIVAHHSATRRKAGDRSSADAAAAPGLCRAIFTSRGSRCYATRFQLTSGRWCRSSFPRAIRWSCCGRPSTASAVGRTMAPTRSWSWTTAAPIAGR